ncbi:MAG: insulinase family protein [Bryobacterales bacterium]|nr:insulinase family protein [Bryobacterales bacterium]
MSTRALSGFVLFVATVLALPLFAQLRLPEYTRQQLPNGVSLVMMPKRDVPLVTLHLQVKGGGESDTATMAGVADITNDLLLRGTATRSAKAIADEVDFLGASISTRSDASANSITLEVLSKDLTQGVQILADLALNSTFPEDEVAKELARALDSAKAMKDNPRSAIGPYAARFFFGNAHPYGNIADEESIARIRREDILAYYQRQYVGANMAVIAVGDFDPAQLQTGLKESFSKAREGKAHSWAEPKPGARPKTPRLLVVNDPQATQTYFQILQPGISVTNKDRVAMMLVNTLFGGRFTSMLMDALRVDAGLTYGVNSLMQQRRMPGSLAISTFTANETTEKAIDMALDVLRKLRAKGVDAEQLASAKAYVKGGTPTQLVETNDQLAEQLASFEVTGLTRDEIDLLFARIDAVTVEDARRVIDTYYRDDNLTFVLLGKREAVDELAKKYAPNPVFVELRAPGVKVTAGE